MSDYSDRHRWSGIEREFWMDEDVPDGMDGCLITFETRYFDWIGFGRNKKEAFESAQCGWLVHCVQTDADVEYFNELVEGGSMSLLWLSFGDFFRDNHLLFNIKDGFSRVQQEKIDEILDDEERFDNWENAEIIKESFPCEFYKKV